MKALYIGQHVDTPKGMGTIRLIENGTYYVEVAGKNIYPFYKDEITPV